MLGREALLAISLVFATFAVAGPSAADPMCEAPWGVASSAPVQDDAASGGDAPERPELALLLPGHGDYVAFLDPLRRDGGDLVDWYALELPASGVAGRFSVSEDYGAVGQPAVVFRLDVFAPGATDEPTATTTSRGDDIVLPLTSAGTWTMRVKVEEPLQVFYLCGEGAALVSGSGVEGGTSDVVRNHVVYFGCDPICAQTA